MYSPSLRRLFNLLVTLPALLVLAPFLLVLARLVRLNLGAPVLFCQQRRGYFAPSPIRLHPGIRRVRYCAPKGAG